MAGKYVLVGWDHSTDPDKRHRASVTVKYEGRECKGESKGGNEAEAYLQAFRLATGLNIREERDPDGSPDRGGVRVTLSVNGKPCAGKGDSYQQAYLAGINAVFGPIPVEDNSGVQRQSVAEALRLERDWTSRSFVPD